MNKKDIAYADRYFHGWTAKDHVDEVKRLNTKPKENKKNKVWHQKMADYKKSQMKESVQSKKLDLLAIPQVRSILNKMLKSMLKESLDSLETNGFINKKPLTTKAIGEILVSGHLDEIFNSLGSSGGYMDSGFDITERTTLMEYLEGNGFFVDEEEENDWNDEKLAGRGPEKKKKR